MVIIYNAFQYAISICYAIFAITLLRYFQYATSICFSIRHVMLCWDYHDCVIAMIVMNTHKILNNSFDGFYP